MAYAITLKEYQQEYFQRKMGRKTKLIFILGLKNSNIFMKEQHKKSVEKKS